MNKWQQRKKYQCPSCEATYLHDRAYFHALFRCPGRAGALATPCTSRVCWMPAGNIC
jgi:ribosomal protein L37AE/L43A